MKADEREGAAVQFTTLATRIPAALRRRVKLFCLEQELRLQDFVAAALEGSLHRAEQGRRPWVIIPTPRKPYSISRR